MKRLSLLLILTLQCAVLTGCKGKKDVESSLPQIVVERDTIGDLYEVLENLKFLVTDGRAVLAIKEGQNVNRLVFMSVEGFHAKPVLLHVSPGVVAIGSGPSRTELGLDELHLRLKQFADSASHAGSEGPILLISDQGVSGEFGFAVLDVILQSGVKPVMLTAMEEISPSLGFLGSKPSAPGSIRKDAEQDVPPKSDRAGG